MGLGGRGCTFIKDCPTHLPEGRMHRYHWTDAHGRLSSGSNASIPREDVLGIASISLPVVVQPRTTLDT